MAPLHSLVNNLRMENRCHQREGVTLRPWYLRWHACNKFYERSKVGALIGHHFSTNARSLLLTATQSIDVQLKLVDG